MIAPGLVDRCTLAPAQALDGRQDGPLVDTRYNVPGYGRLYLSWQTIRDCARLYGMLESDVALAVEQELADTRIKLAQAETALADAAPILASIAKLSDKFRDTDELAA